MFVSVHASACMCMHAFIMTSQGINQNMLSQYFFILVKGHWAKQLNAPLTISVVAGTGKSADWVTPGLTVYAVCLLVYHNQFYTRLGSDACLACYMTLKTLFSFFLNNSKTKFKIKYISCKSGSGFKIYGLSCFPKTQTRNCKAGSNLTCRSNLPIQPPYIFFASYIIIHELFSVVFLLGASPQMTRSVLKSQGHKTSSIYSKMTE